MLTCYLETGKRTKGIQLENWHYPEVYTMYILNYYTIFDYHSYVIMILCDYKFMDERRYILRTKKAK